MPWFYKHLLPPVDNLLLTSFKFHAERKNTGNPGWWSKELTNLIKNALLELSEMQSWYQQSSLHPRGSPVFKYAAGVLASGQRSEVFQVNKMRLTVSHHVLLWVGERRLQPPTLLATEDGKNHSEDDGASFCSIQSLFLPVVLCCRLSPCVQCRTRLPLLPLALSRLINMGKLWLLLISGNAGVRALGIQMERMLMRG